MPTSSLPDDLRPLIEAAFLDRKLLREAHYNDAVRITMEKLDAGVLRVAEKTADGWITNGWVKEAILLYFGLQKSAPIECGGVEFFDKVPPKRDLNRFNIRVVPPGLARYGSFLEPGCILMPGYVNIGARVGAGTMVDTWATVGSCAQIGARVHLSGGVGIGGVLEPATARPVIVEDGAFVGSRCVIVEDGAFVGSRVVIVDGVHVGAEAVLGAGVVLTASTAILDVSGKAVVEHRGRIPARSVVIPGVRTKKFPAGEFGVPCALIIGQRSAGTDRKVSLNQALRDFAVPV